MTFAPSTKALTISIVLGVPGISLWIYRLEDFYTTLPLFIFYCVLVFNTYFSIKLFSQIIPGDNVLQKIMDAILIILYVLLALNIHSIIWFVLVDTLLFIMAAAKYAFLLNHTDHPLLLKRKILIDLLGILLSTLTLVGIISGYETVSVWLFAMVFLIANILLLSVWPMYRLDR